MRINRRLAAFGTIAVLALAAAACGGAGSGGSTPTATPGGGTVQLAGTGLGSVLVDKQGMTVYLFEGDTGGSSMCSGQCATNWPPLTVSGMPTAGNGLDTAKLSTTTRPDGTKQVTYNGHPLYLFSGDSKAGQTNGEGLNAFGAEWYAVSSTGSTVEKQAVGGGGY